MDSSDDCPLRRVGEPKKIKKDFLSEMSALIASSEKSVKNLDEIVHFIKSGRADVYLNKIITKEIPSKYEKAYQREKICREKFGNLLFKPTVSCSGSLDKRTIREILSYLLPLYRNRTIATKSKRYPSFLDHLSAKKISGDPSYVGLVWLPESVIYAMSNIYNISLEVANELFEKKSDIQYMESPFSHTDAEAKYSES